MMFESSDTISANGKLQHLCKILCAKALQELKALSIQIISTTMTYLNQVILLSGKFLFTINSLRDMPWNEEATQTNIEEI